jgi:recombination protein RecT
MSTLRDRVKQSTQPEQQDAEQAEAEQTLDLVARDSAFQWLERRRKRLQLALPSHIEASHVIEAARHSMDKLRRCTPESIDSALMACARFGLAPNGVDAALVPFGKTATFVPMYRGLISVMHRSGVVGSVRAGLIRERDAWNYEPTAPVPNDFFFKPRVELSVEQRGEVILAYAFAWLRDGARSQVVILNKQEAIEIRDLHSRAYANAESNGKRDSAWHTNFNAQWRKSCLRRLANYVPTSPEIVALLRADTDAEAGRPPAIPGEYWETPQPGSSDGNGGATAWPPVTEPGTADTRADSASAGADQ